MKSNEPLIKYGHLPNLFSRRFADPPTREKKNYKDRDSGVVDRYALFPDSSATKL